MSNIVVIAHNSMKPKLVDFLTEREDWLWGKKVIATGLTAQYLKDKSFRVPLASLSPGREGGYKELKKMVDDGEVQMVIFFRDPHVEQEYHADVTDFIKACNIENIPLATNEASAELLIIGYIRRESAQSLKERSLLDN